MKNYYDLGWVDTMNGNNPVHYGVRYPKKELLGDVLIASAFVVFSICLHKAFKQTYFKGAEAGIKAEYEALEKIGCIK